MRFRIWRTAIVVVAVPGVLVSGSASAGGLSPARIIERLNAERVAHGLPGGVRVNLRTSRGCGLHNRWMKLNGRLQHEEIRGTKGYTRLGASAGLSSVLAKGSWREGNPWANAPMHLASIFDPRVMRSGASDAHGHSCMSVDVAGSPLTEDRVWTLPRDGGSVPYTQRAYEAPFTPQERIGLPADRVTGPYLYVWSTSAKPPQLPGPPPPAEVVDPVTGELIEDPSADAYYELEEQHRAWDFDQIVAGSVVDPAGRKVPTRAIDNRDVEGYASPGGGWLLPLRPLRPSTRYTASVTVAASRVPGRTLTYEWSFATGRRPFPGLTP